MNAAILAAGVGSRLRPITVERPKCCVSVDGTSILSHQLRAYADAGFDQAYVVAGYMADAVRAECEAVGAEHPEFEVTVRENPAFANTDNLYSLYQLQADLDGEPFVLSNGDVVFDPAILERLAEDAADAAIACDSSTYTGEAMKVQLDEAGRVTHLSKEIDRNRAAAVGIDVYRFSPAASATLFDRIERTIEVDGEYLDWTERVIDELASETAYDVEPVDVAGHPWVEVDDHEDLLAADRTFSSIRDLDEKEAVFFDLDGTLYVDEALTPGAAEAVAAFRFGGADVYFLSNNSSAWKTDYAAKLDSLGIPAEPSDVVLSTDGVIDYLHERGMDSTYVVGTTAMREAITERDIEVTAPDPDAVVVGFDTELDYEKVREATLAIRDGAEFLLAHPDLVCPTARGFVPDCGSIGKLVAAATGREPTETFGKPNEAMLEGVLREQGLRGDETVVVGDRLETEVELANRLGADSVCVLTGATDRATIESASVRPSLVVETVGDLVAQGFVTGGGHSPSGTVGSEQSSTAED